MNLRSNSFYSLGTAAVILIAVTVLKYITPPLGNFLLICSAVPFLLLAISAIQWAKREKSGLEFASSIAVLIVLAYGFLLFAHMPYDPMTLTADDLAYVQLGQRFEDIASEIGGGEWIPEHEVFTVAYEVERDMQLVLVFEDGIHLSGITLSRPNAPLTTMRESTILRSTGQ